MRTLRRTLGRPPTSRFQSSTRPGNIERVVLSPIAARFLRQQLHLPGRARGGLLFGHHHAETLHVLLAGTGGLPWWYRGDEKRGVLDIDARFTLGWSEAVGELLQGHADWCGNWLVHPDEQVGSEERNRRWLRRGAKLGLLDDRHLLLVVGYDEERFGVRAFLLYPPDDLFEARCEFGGVRLDQTLRQLADLLGGESGQS